MAREPTSDALAWARRSPPRALDDAPAAVQRHLAGTRTAMRVLWGIGLGVALLVGLTGPSLQEKAANFAGAAVFISFGLLALSRAILRSEQRWLTAVRAEAWRVSNVELITVRDAKSVARVHEVALTPERGGAPRFAYLKTAAPHVKAGLELAVLPRGPRALVFGLGEDLSIAVATPLRRAA